MRHAVTIASISVIVVCAAAAADAQEDAPLDPQIAPLANAHLAAAIETSAGDGGPAVGLRALFSYDVLRGSGDTYRPALGVGVLLGVTSRDIEMSSKGITDVGALVTASLRFHTKGVIIDRRVFASAGILRESGPMTSQTGMRYSLGVNWFSASAESRKGYLFLLPHQIEGFYQEQLGDHRYGVAVGYGF